MSSARVAALRARTLRPVLAATAVALLGACGGGQPDVGAADAVEIRGVRVVVEVARSPQQKARGLSGRRELAWGAGMLFPYARPAFQRFWMKDMHFPIDIVWIRDGRIVAIAHRVPPPEPGAPDAAIPTVRSGQLVDAVLEVPAGFAASHGWQAGDRVQRSGGASAAH